MQKQLEQVRKERAEREKEDAKDREIKRRQEAKMLQEAQQSRVDKENKIYFEKIKKERQEDEAHRKRVREQIARDRAEKIAQRNAEKQRQNSTFTTLPTDEGASSSSLNDDSRHAYSNLNIRQLDGSNIRHQFEGIYIIVRLALKTYLDWFLCYSCINIVRSAKLDQRGKVKLVAISIQSAKILYACRIAQKMLKSRTNSPLNFQLVCLQTQMTIQPSRS